MYDRRAKADTVALDFAIINSLEKWAGLDPSLLPEKIRKHYDLKENVLEISKLTLEEKMLVWGLISPNNKVFIYFSDDGKCIQERDLNYADSLPAEPTVDDERDSLEGTVVTDKNVIKYLQRLELSSHNDSFNKMKDFKNRDRVFTLGKKFQMDFAGVLKMIFFNHAFRIDRFGKRHGVSRHEFDLLLGCSLVDDFTIKEQMGYIKSIKGENIKHSNIYKTSNMLLKKGLITKTKHGRASILDTTIRGEEVLTKILKHLSQYDYTL